MIPDYLIRTSKEAPMNQVLNNPALLPLAFLPVLSIVIGVLYGIIGEKKAPSVMPLMTISALIQAVTVLVTTFALNSKVLSPFDNSSLITLTVILVILLLLQIAVVARATDMTQSRVRRILKDGRISPRTGCLDISTLEDIGLVMIEPDIRPGLISEHKRRQRELFVTLIKRAMDMTTTIEPDEFLLTKEELQWGAQLYVALGIGSVVALAITIGYFLYTLNLPSP